MNLPRVCLSLDSESADLTRRNIYQCFVLGGQKLELDTFHVGLLHPEEQISKASNAKV